jgi:serine protease Do
MSKRNKTFLIATLVAGLGLGTLAGTGIATARAAAATPDATPLTIPSPVQLSNAFSVLAKRLEPSVVQIQSTIEQKPARMQFRGGAPGGQDGGDNPFGWFFGNPFGDTPQQPQQPRRGEATGSGFVVDKNGYILTNNHVVDGATRVQVKLMEDQKLYTAKVVGTDSELDLAVLKIEADKPLPAVKIGNSDAAQPGDWALAIGSPFGLEATVTAGIISAQGRSLPDPDHQLQKFIQTDASINPGNSGGPLLNINGEVIGVNTMILSGTGHFEGIGFALPINLAVNAYNQIIKTGKVSRGAIGILFNREPKAELLKVYGATEGVFVTQVNPGSPADRAGIKEQDIITRFNGKPVKDGDSLVAMVSETPVGTKAPVTLLRDGKPLDLTLEVGDRKDIIAGAARPGKPESADAQEAGPAKFGMSVRELGPQDRQSLRTEEKAGVLVAGVDPGSFAEDVGLLQGDILVAINRQPVNSAADVRRIGAELKPGVPVAFKVLRRQGNNWQAFFTAGTLPKS